MEINITLLWQIVLFLLLFVWLSRALFAPMLAVFEERERRIEGARNEAAQLSTQAEQKAHELQKKVDDAMASARAELNHLKSEGLKIQQETVDQAKLDAKHRIEQASIELRKQMDRARQELRSQASGMAEDVMMKLLGTKSKNSDRNPSRSKVEVSGA